MSKDITQDPEYIRGYEAAKKQIEEDNSPYYQGFHATKQEEREKRFSIKEPVESTPDPYMQMLKSIDERLARLEKYTQE